MTRSFRPSLWLVPMLLLATVPSAHAQVARTFDELAAYGRLKPGDRVSLSGPHGEKATGVFRGWQSGSLELFLPDEKRQAVFAEKDVLGIRRAGTHGLAFGVAIGAASAATATAFAAASYGENEQDGFCGACFLQWSAISVPVGMGIGAAIGIALDALRREPLFAAALKPGRVGVAPLVARKGAGVRVAVRF